MDSSLEVLDCVLEEVCLLGLELVLSSDVEFVVGGLVGVCIG